MSPVSLLRLSTFFSSVCTLGASLGNQREQPGYVWGMCVRSKDQFPSLHCREHRLEVTFSWCPGNWPLALECDISRWTEEPLLFSLTKRYHKKLIYIKIFVLKPVVGRRLCYEAKLGLQVSVAWMNARHLMFLPNFLVLSVPQRVAVAMLAEFSHLGLPCGSSFLEVSWWALMAVNSGLLCCKWGRMLRLIQITRKPAVGCSCNSAEELIWDYAVIGRGNFTYSFLQELPLLYGLFGIGFFSSSLENPVPIKSPVCMWEYWNTDNLMWKSFWS